jgi:iron complex transport system ATP-binding protein
MMTLIRVEQVSFAYDGRPVLDGISVDIAAGERVGLLGPNGAGKTTLLRLLSGTLAPAAGSVMVKGKPLVSTPRLEVAHEIAVVPQEFVVPFAFTVQEIVEMGRMPYVGMLRGLRSNDRRAVQHAIELTDTSKLAGRIFNELSGGERQRAIIAMALAQEPQILLLDEPTRQLDITRQAEILDLITGLNRSRTLTVIAAIHDLNLAARYFDRLVLLRAGSVLADGTPNTVLRRDLIELTYDGPVEVVQSPLRDVPVIVPASRLANNGTNSAIPNADSELC